MDDNATDAFLAYSMYFSPEEENNKQIHSKVTIKSLKVNGAADSLSTVEGLDLSRK
jgi:hypothetical protein